MLLVIGFTTGLYAQTFKEVSATSGVDHTCFPDFFMTIYSGFPYLF